MMNIWKRSCRLVYAGIFVGASIVLKFPAVCFSNASNLRMVFQAVTSILFCCYRWVRNPAKNSPFDSSNMFCTCYDHIK